MSDNNKDKDSTVTIPLCRFKELEVAEKALGELGTSDGVYIFRGTTTKLLNKEDFCDLVSKQLIDENRVLEEYKNACKALKIQLNLERQKYQAETPITNQTEKKSLFSRLWIALKGSVK